MKITISGTLGSGKSTVTKLLSENLNYPTYSTGIIMRKIAEQRKISLQELSNLAENDKSIDEEIDNFQINLGKTQNKFILEGRLGFHFISDSIKIFLKCSQDVAAERVLKELKGGSTFRIKEGLSENKETIKKDFLKRRNSEEKRYLALYNLNINDESNFDLVIDTTNITPEEVCNKIIEFINKKNIKNKN